MLIKECGDKIIDGEKSIFLMGPISNFGDNYWYEETLSKLETNNYDGVVYIPYNDNYPGNKNIWNVKAIRNATVVAFWIPRKNPDMLGLDVNLYFGQCLDMDKMIYGRPNNGYKNTDLDNLYFIFKQELPIDDLDEFVFETIKKVNILCDIKRVDLKDIFDKTNSFYENVAMLLSKEEYSYIRNNLPIEKKCSNCTTFCCGGINGCSRWDNEEEIGKVKVLGSLKK